MREFQEIYERYRPDVYRFALFLTGEPGRAEDLTADTFVRAFVARDRIKVATVRNYLLTITKNLYRDECRRAKPLETIAEAVPDPRPPADVRVQGAIDLGLVRARLRQIARGDRRALLMSVYREMSHQEIAEALGVSIGAVKSRIHRARAALLGEAT